MKERKNDTSTNVYVPLFGGTDAAGCEGVPTGFTGRWQLLSPLTAIVNDFAGTHQNGQPLGHDRDPRGLIPKDFVLGGFGKIIVMPGRPPAKSFLDSFTGYIDEVRISTEARYDVGKKGFMPRKNTAPTEFGY